MVTSEFAALSGYVFSDNATKLWLICYFFSCFLLFNKFFLLSLRTKN
jgi:hypothetical protein